MMSSKIVFSVAALSGALSVIFGAFAAHGLKPRLTPENLQVFETGVRYQFYHTLALLFVGWCMWKLPSGWFSYSALAMIAGMMLFSGSLYVLATRSLLGIEHWSWLGPVTPVGGFAFIIGWFLFLIGILKSL